MACAAILAEPAAASSYNSRGASEYNDEVPVVLDAFLMRPIGIGVTAVGFATWAVFSPVMAVTRPTDMAKTFKSYVINPARFTWVDPIGYHPDRDRAESRGEIR
jgi:hypothetical protein